MYLLQIEPETAYLIKLLLGALVSFFILYRIILAADSSALNEKLEAMEDAVRLQNQLLILDTRKRGIAEEEIQNEIDFVYSKSK